MLSEGCVPRDLILTYWRKAALSHRMCALRRAYLRGGGEGEGWGEGEGGGGGEAGRRWR